MISVVICTYNRAHLLPTVLQTVCEQALDCAEYEVLVVDNNSTDESRLVTESFMQRYENLRYCFEPQQGLSYARNRGWQEARGKYVAYTDDECKVPPQWLTVAKEVIVKHSPAVLGGPYFPFYDRAKPPWFRDQYALSLQQKVSGPLDKSPRKYLSGGNLFFDKTVLQKVGGFDVNLGQQGKRLGYGEDSGLVNYIRFNMPEELVYYEPQLFLFHLVRPNKMTMRWLTRSRFVNGRYSYRSHSIYGTKGKKPPEKRQLVIVGRLAINALKLVVTLVYGVLFRNRSTYPYFHNYWYEHSFTRLHLLGQLYEQYQHVTRA